MRCAPSRCLRRSRRVRRSLLTRRSCASVPPTVASVPCLITCRPMPPTLRRYGGAFASGSVVLWPLSAGQGTLSSVVKSSTGGIGDPRHPVFRRGAAARLCRPAVGAACRKVAAPARHRAVPDALDRRGSCATCATAECRRVFLTAGCSEELGAALAPPIACHPLGPPSQLRLFD